VCSARAVLLRVHLAQARGCMCAWLHERWVAHSLQGRVARSFQVLNQRYDIVFYYFSNITTVPGSAGQVGWCAAALLHPAPCPACLPAGGRFAGAPQPYSTLRNALHVRKQCSALTEVRGQDTRHPRCRCLGSSTPRELPTASHMLR
jgi:hypothetical protein